MPNIDFPLHFDLLGRTAAADDTAHLRQLIEQALLTAPGERVMRPDFGAGLLALVFEPNGGTLAATTQMLVQAALQQHLAHRLAVRWVRVLPQDAALRVEVGYTVLEDGSEHDQAFTLPGPSA